MNIWMDVDTALAEVPVNLLPLTDDTDFKSIEASVAYNATGLTLLWNFITTGGAFTQTAVTPTTGGAYDWASQGNGMYSIEIPASGGASINNDTEGFGWFSGVATGVLPWRGPVIGFRAAALNNSLVDGTTIDVNVTAMATDSLTAAALKADAVTEIQNGLATPTNITAGTITTVTNLTNLPTMPTDWLTAAGLSAGAVTKIQAGLALEATLTAIKGVGWTTETLVAIDVLIDAIKAKTDTIPANPAQVGSAMTLANDAVSAAALAADAVAEIQNGLATPTNITAGTLTTVTNLTNLPAITANWLTAAGIAADAVAELQAGLALEATLTAIKGAGWTTETLAAIDVLIDAIKAKTDNLPASPAAVGSAMTLANNAVSAAALATDAVAEIAAAIDLNPVVNVTGAIAVSATEAQSVASGVMEVSVYYTLNQSVTSTYSGDLSSATKVWFAVKDIGDTDANSLIFLEKTAGLTIVNKTTYATTSAGGLVITGSAGDWDIAVEVDEAATTLLSSYANLYKEASIKALVDGDAVHIWDGECRITSGVVRTIS